MMLKSGVVCEVMYAFGSTVPSPQTALTRDRCFASFAPTRVGTELMFLNLRVHCAQYELDFSAEGMGNRELLKASDCVHTW